MYEANPMAMLIEQAGGAATTGRGRILDVAPDSLHQRVPVILGSKNEVERLERYHQEYDTARTVPSSRRCSPNAPCSATNRAPEFKLQGDHHVRQTSHHRHHRLIRRRHQHGDAELSAHLPPRKAQGPDRRGRFLPSLRPQGDARRDEGAGGATATNFSHFGPEANLLEELAGLFKLRRRAAAARCASICTMPRRPSPTGQEPGTFTPWQDIPGRTDLMFYEGLHGACRDDKIDIAKQVDLCVGVVPTVNLEWIQKLHRDQKMRGYSQEAVVDTILRRMPDYVNHLTRSSRAPTSISSACRSSIPPTLHRPRHSDRRRKHGGDPLRQSQGHRFPYLLSMICTAFLA
jgi:hypothetical protein